MSEEKLEAVLDLLQSTKSIKELQVWAHELRDYFRVSHIVYHTVTLKGEQIGAFTYSLDWARRYVEKDYRRFDPVILGALRRFHPMDWKSLDWSSPQARELMREARAAGLGNQGWSVPIWGPQGESALFAVNHTASDDDWADFIGRNQKDILLVSHLMHQQAMRMINKEVEPSGADLSPRERETLAQLSLGRNRAEVAETIGISENTLRAYIDSARHKLGAHNVTHAVALAIARGIIVPPGPLPKY